MARPTATGHRKPLQNSTIDGHCQRSSQEQLAARSDLGGSNGLPRSARALPSHAWWAWARRSSDQYGGCAAHHSPSARNASQKSRLASRSSRESSMLGT